MGGKRLRRIERLLGVGVRHAVTRTGWPHYVADVWAQGAMLPFRFNYRTGAILDLPDDPRLARAFLAMRCPGLRMNPGGGLTGIEKVC